MADPFQFELVSPERLLMSDEVEQVVVPGSEGYFTVMKGHAPFMSTMRPGVVDVTKGGQMDRIFVRGGFADVSAAGPDHPCRTGDPARRGRPGDAG